MTVDDAVDLIFRRLCNDLRTRGQGATMSRQSLGSGIPEEVFMAALRQLRGPRNDQDLLLEFVGGSPDQIRLGASWRGRCEDSK